VQNILVIVFSGILLSEKPKRSSHCR